MLTPVVIGGRRLGLLKRFKHLQVLLVDLLNLFLSRAEVQGARSAWYGDKHRTMPCILWLLLTAHLI